MENLNTNQFLLSIIVPVFNVSSLLNRCIDSIKMDLFNEIEVIIIDDGSTDDSGNIADLYAKKNCRCRVVHKKNEGLSCARNDGINMSSGQYIMFLDSDDFILENSLGQILENLHCSNHDIYVGKAKLFDDHGFVRDKTFSNISQGLYDKKTYLEKLFKFHMYSPCSTFLIYKKSFITSHNLQFAPGIIFEDELWMANILINASHIYYMNLFFYGNYIRSDSITHSSDNYKIENSVIFLSQALNMLYSQLPKKEYKALKEEYVSMYLFGYCKAINKDFFIRKENKKNLIKYSFSAKYKMLTIFFTIFPKLYLRFHYKIRGF